MMGHRDSICRRWLRGLKLAGLIRGLGGKMKTWYGKAFVKVVVLCMMREGRDWRCGLRECSGGRPKMCDQRKDG